MNKYMELAIDEARNGILNKDGGPFGAVIVKSDKVIGKGHNRVLSNCDPTCHGEIEAIRDACKNLKTYNLDGCDLYTTGEPCNMCLCACMWANIHKIYFGATIQDNSKIGFRDSKFDKIFGGRSKLDSYLINIDRSNCLDLFDEYNNMNKTIY